MSETFSSSLSFLLSELDGLDRRAGRLEGLADAFVREHQRIRRDLDEVRAFLEMAPQAQARLEELSRELFGELMEEVESNLTHAVREILGQDRRVVSRREVKQGKFHITLEMENQGQVEDILHGQGGSVCNILSVGLRLIGLAQLDPEKHRRFLVLDEQDCWLRPELVPTFTRLIAAIGEKLGLQVLTISHHAVDAFYGHAGRVFQLSPSRESGVTVTVLGGTRVEEPEEGESVRDDETEES
ncbi:hypothetical protein [Fundidesulfovibrio terrae]|uniref:hypothetical protein n=1 Tax=Fundidesulfovibrio terrae TaxID=2922866 RepID=UPI001FAF8ABA|nr:hypothetical protein [Fundidesulfovibrio terrae]